MWTQHCFPCSNKICVIRHSFSFQLEEDIVLFVGVDPNVFLFFCLALKSRETKMFIFSQAPLRLAHSFSSFIAAKLIPHHHSPLNLTQHDSSFDSIPSLPSYFWFAFVILFNFQSENLSHQSTFLRAIWDFLNSIINCKITSMTCF